MKKLILRSSLWALRSPLPPLRLRPLPKIKPIEPLARRRVSNGTTPQRRAQRDTRTLQKTGLQKGRRPKSDASFLDACQLSERPTFHPNSRALSLASFQAFPTNAACEIGDRRSTCSGKRLP